MTLSAVSVSGPDALRLLALPVFVWVAVVDVRTRRIPRDVWIPLALLGLVTLAWDGLRAADAGGGVWVYDFLLPVATSIGFVVPLAYCFWWMGGFGGADAKALLVLAILYPMVPAYTVGSVTVPIESGPHGAFAFIILVNAVLLGVVVPLGLALWNARRGQVGVRAFVARQIDIDRVPTAHGRLLEPDGSVFGGVDLDAVRMYCRWRGITLAELRERPDHHRDPDSIPEDPNPPTDGRVTDGGQSVDDPWGARAFLTDIEGSAYGTDAPSLRRGLETLVSDETVWVSPGMPFLVLVLGGLVVALVYGDVPAAVLS